MANRDFFCQLRKAPFKQKRCPAHPKSAETNYAVKLWCSNEDEAFVRYDSIKFWDVSRITDFDELSSIDRHRAFENCNPEVCDWDVQRRIVVQQNVFTGPKRSTETWVIGVLIRMRTSKRCFSTPRMKVRKVGSQLNKMSHTVK